MISLFGLQTIPYINTTTAKTLKEHIINNIEKSSHSAKVFGIILTICIAPLVIPLFLILRKRFALHERVFDLLTSVDVDEIEKEIKTLIYTSNIVYNYLQYSGALKENMLHFEENAIIPNGENTLIQGDNQMVLGIGDAIQCEV